MVLPVTIRRATKPGVLAGVALLGPDAPDGNSAIVLCGRVVIEARTRAVVGVSPSALWGHVEDLLSQGYCVRHDPTLASVEG